MLDTEVYTPAPVSNGCLFTNHLVPRRCRISNVTDGLPVASEQGHTYEHRPRGAGKAGEKQVYVGSPVEPGTVACLKRNLFFVCAEACKDWAAS